MLSIAFFRRLSYLFYYPLFTLLEGWRVGGLERRRGKGKGKRRGVREESIGGKEPPPTIHPSTPSQPSSPPKTPNPPPPSAVDATKVLSTTPTPHVPLHKNSVLKCPTLTPLKTCTPNGPRVIAAIRAHLWSAVRFAPPPHHTHARKPCDSPGPHTRAKQRETFSAPLYE
jgi:hypothetical protein